MLCKNSKIKHIQEWWKGSGIMNRVVREGLTAKLKCAQSLKEVRSQPYSDRGENHAKWREQQMQRGGLAFLNSGSQCGESGMYKDCVIKRGSEWK